MRSLGQKMKNSLCTTTTNTITVTTAAGAAATATATDLTKSIIFNARKWDDHKESLPKCTPWTGGGYTPHSRGMWFHITSKKVNWKMDSYATLPVLSPLQSHNAEKPQFQCDVADGAPQPTVNVSSKLLIPRWKDVYSMHILYICNDVYIIHTYIYVYILFTSLSLLYVPWCFCFYLTFLSE